VTAGGAASMTLDPVGATGTSDAIHSELSGGTRQVKVFTMPNLHDGPSAGSSSVGTTAGLLPTAAHLYTRGSKCLWAGSVLPQSC
jgi:hypothetical protein